MKKTLLLLATLTCASLSAGTFEDICRSLRIEQQLFQSSEVDISPALLNAHLAALLWVADGNDRAHERVLRRLAELHCQLPSAQWPPGRKPGSTCTPPYMVDFANGKRPFCAFLAFAKQHLGGPKAGADALAINTPWILYNTSCVLHSE